MPTYEYKCQQCGYIFEKFMGINEPATLECPKCHNQAERLISGGSGVILKGSGFYQNDYKKETCCSRGEPCDSPKKCCEQ